MVNKNKLISKFKYYSKYGEINTKFFADYYLKDNTFKMAAVYSIHNIITNKVYIGSTSDLLNRWRQHYNALKAKNHEKRELQEDANNYTIESFKWHIVYLVNNTDDLIKYEKYYIDFYLDNNVELYNKRVKNVDTNKEITFDEAVRKNMSLAQKGKKLSQETKRKISESNKGKKHTDLAKEKLKIAHQGSNSINAKLTEKEAYQIKELLLNGKSQKDIAVLFQVDTATISDIKNLNTWTHVKHKNDKEMKNFKSQSYKGSKNGSAKLNETDIPHIRRRIFNGDALTNIAKDYGVSRTLIGHIKRGKLWSHIS